ncbi:MAG: serine protease, partial [Pirellulales bacterium]|nr:serine protease [Pirellulales bacterium]
MKSSIGVVPVMVIAGIALAGFAIGKFSSTVEKPRAVRIAQPPVIAPSDGKESQSSPPVQPTIADSAPSDTVQLSLPEALAAGAPEVPVLVPDASPQSVVKNADRAVVTLDVTSKEGRSTGSGFLIKPLGTVVTNYHVVEGATQVRMTLYDGRSADVSGWLAIAPGKDLALLQVQLDGASTLEVSPDQPAKADPVFALGAPLGLAGTVANGIVSSIRSGKSLLPELDANAVWIQTTAPVSPGNSGGPLIDASGRVLAVNTMSRASGQNINFAISAEHIQELLTR